MSKQMLRSARAADGRAEGVRDMALDIVSYGRRGPAGTLHLGAGAIAQIRRTVGRAPEVMVKVSGGGRDTGGVEAHLRYVSRHGKLSFEVDEGPSVQGRGAAREIVSDWQLDLCRSEYKPKPLKGQKENRAKLAHNIVLSMPAGTPPEKVLAAARIFARENFALQHRYAMVLHTDQAHPHVHLVVKCEHEFEPHQRLYIRKDTLRQWREQFAALMREQGVAANATPRQVRGQIRKPLKDAIHHRLRALRSFAQLSLGERQWRRQPKTSTFMLAKLEAAFQGLRERQGGGALNDGQAVMQGTRHQVASDWSAVAQRLRKQGEAELAAQVERFVERMPVVKTDARRIAEQWRAQARSRSPERADAREPGQPIR